MAELPTLFRGANRLLIRQLTLANGTPLPVASLAGARAQCVQDGQVRATAVLGTDAALHAGDAAHELVYEITSVVSAQLRAGYPLTVRWPLRHQNAAFVAEQPGQQIDIQEEVVAQIA